MDKLVKIRKQHNCYICHRIMSVGEIADYHNFKSPRYDDNDKQVGIEYLRFYICGDNHDKCFV
jgi:cytochrome c peroxidase